MTTPHDAATVLRGLAAPWWVAGGWAIDLLVGRQTRDHSDLDVAMLRADQHRLYAHLDGWDLRYATAQGTLRRWDGGTLEAPVHEVWARRSQESWVLEVLLNEHDDGQWVYRREPAVRMPLHQLGLHRGDIPFLCPEVVLLYKSKRPTANDEADFRVAEPHLSDDRRSWLRSALPPQHPWFALLQ